LAAVAATATTAAERQATERETALDPSTRGAR